MCSGIQNLNLNYNHVDSYFYFYYFVVFSFFFFFLLLSQPVKIMELSGVMHGLKKYATTGYTLNIFYDVFFSTKGNVHYV